MKKAQAAMEFLMTYGWAILVVIVAIGALYYFVGVNPDRFLNPTCTLIPGLDCQEDFKVTSSGATLVVRNNMGATVTVNSLTLSGTGVSGCTPQSGSINYGSSTTFTIPCSTFPSSGRVKASINLDYIKSGSLLNHNITGSLVGTIE